MLDRLKTALGGGWDRRLSGASLLVFYTQAGIFFLGIALSVALARALQPTGRGQFGIITLVPAFLSQFVDPCLGNAIIYLLGQRRASVIPLAVLALGMAVADGLVAFLLFSVVVSIPALSAWLGLTIENAGMHLLFASVLMVPFLLINQYCGTILLSANRIVEFNLTRFLVTVIQFGLVAMVLPTGRLDLAWAISAYVIALVATALISIWLVKRTTGLKPSDFLSHPDYRLWKEALRFGLRGYAARILAFGTLRLDAFLIATMMTSADVGVYMVAVTLVERISMVPDALATVLFPRVASSSAGDGVNLTAMACRHTILIVTLIAASLALLSYPLVILLYGSAYSGAVIALLGLLPGVVTLSMGAVVSSFITGKGRPEYGVGPALVSLIANVMANLYLIPRLGILGAAIASTIAYTLAAAMLVVIFFRMSRARLSDILLVRRSDIEFYGQMTRAAWQRATRLFV